MDAQAGASRQDGGRLRASQPDSMDARLRETLLRREGRGCVARYVNSRLWATRWPMLQGLPDPGLCRDAYGQARDPFVVELTIEEVKIDAPGEPGSHLRMGVKAGYSLETCVCVCPGHHVFGFAGVRWCTMEVVRQAMRLYIVAANARLPELLRTIW